MKHKMRFYIIFSCVVLIIAGFLFFQYGDSFFAKVSLGDSSNEKSAVQGGSGDRKIPVSIFIADFQITQVGIPTIGTLLPYEQVTLSSEIAGKVELINFKEGSSVSKGDLLVKINDDDLQAQLKRLVAQRRLAFDKFERGKVLFERNAISREVLEQSEADYLMNEADIDLVRVKIDRTEIKAPFDGTIGFRSVGVGSYLQPGTQIAHLVDDSKLRLEFSIPEKYSQQIEKGLPIDFKTVDQAEEHLARVYAIDPKIDIDTRTIGIRALYVNARRKLKGGMSAVVNIGQKRGRSLQIPTQAIVPENNSMKVWVVRNGKASSVPVVTGLRGDRFIEIKEGVAQGDSVIITGLLQIKEGSSLLINP